MNLILKKDLKRYTYDEFIVSLIIKKTIKSPLKLSKDILADGFAEIDDTLYDLTKTEE
jgi:hypothetical protein